MPYRIRPNGLAWVLVVMACARGLSQTAEPSSPSEPRPGRRVEVLQVDDTWRVATVIEEGDSVLKVRYDNGLIKLVLTSKVRASTAAPAASQPASVPDDVSPESGPCEVKIGVAWKRAAIRDYDGELYLVEMDGPGMHRQSQWRWVAGETVRAVGSQKDGPTSGKFVVVGGNDVSKANAIARRQLPTWRRAYRVGVPHADRTATTAPNESDHDANRREN